MKQLILTAIAGFIYYCSAAQAIDNTPAYKNISAEQYIRFNYENDFFSAKDEYYTQGVHIEMVATFLKKNPLTWLLVKPRTGTNRYGLAFQHNGYTPTTVDYNEIQYGDRPFAGTMFLQSFVLNTDTARKSRFSSVLTTGIIGPLAGAGQMQRSIHKWTNNYTPHGWDNQVRNDIALNYQVGYEKLIYSYRNYIMLSADAFGRVGTLSDKAGIGGTLMLGYFQTPFGDNSKTQKFSLYGYIHPGLNIVGYDATLQGGMLNNDSPYTIPADDINRITTQTRMGVVLQYKWLNLEYFHSLQSPEFRNQRFHPWGGVQLGINL